MSHVVEAFELFEWCLLFLLRMYTTADFMVKTEDKRAWGGLKCWAQLIQVCLKFSASWIKSFKNVPGFTLKLTTCQFFNSFFISTCWGHEAPLSLWVSSVYKTFTLLFAARVILHYQMLSSYGFVCTFFFFHFVLM